MNTGEKLRLARKAKHLTYRKLAELTGISPTSLSNYERGLAEPSFINMCCLSDALGVSLSALSGKPDVVLDKPRLSEALYMCRTRISQLIPSRDRAYLQAVVDAAQTLYNKYGG